MLITHLGVVYQVTLKNHCRERAGVELTAVKYQAKHRKQKTPVIDLEFVNFSVSST